MTIDRIVKSLLDLQLLLNAGDNGHFVKERGALILVDPFGDLLGLLLACLGESIRVGLVR